MRYKVTLSYTADVEADNEFEAQEIAETALKRDMQHASLREVMNVHYGENKVYIPENDYLIQEGYYDLDGLVELLRSYKAMPGAIQFIADMLEA